MKPEEARLLARVCAEPDDDLPRLVYADWLDEHGDPRGEFIRVQIALSRREDRAEVSLADRERDLLYHHRSDWLARLDEHWRGDAVFERGFVDQVTVRAQT